MNSLSKSSSDSSSSSSEDDENFAHHVRMLKARQRRQSRVNQQRAVSVAAQQAEEPQHPPKASASLVPRKPASNKAPNQQSVNLKPDIPKLASQQRSVEVALKHGNQRGKKRKLVAITDQFNIEEKESQGKLTSIATCKHCKKVTQGPVLRINVSRLRDHLTLCQKITEEERRICVSSSQRAKKLKKHFDLTSKGTDRAPFPSSKPKQGSYTLGSKPMSSIRKELNQF